MNLHLAVMAELRLVTIEWMDSTYYTSMILHGKKQVDGQNFQYFECAAFFWQQ